jgi:parallel beta helix pectate lyase-like protein
MKQPLHTLAAALLVTLTSHCASPEAQERTLDASQARVLHVGAARELKRPSAAAKVARDGDIIEIDAGVYAGDAAVWRQNRLTIRGAGGRAHLRADGAEAEGKAIWVVKGADTTIESVEFSGASVSDQNGAGIRLEGPGLTVRDCYFHDNENGILTGPNKASDVVIERSEFARNGAGDGKTHNMYIGNVRSFTLLYSYVHHAVVGHNVKSRAAKNYVAYNRIADESDGRSSYDVEFPDGGLAFVIGNVIHKGPAAENSTVVSYGAESLGHPLNELYFVNNTVVSDLGGRFLFVKVGTPAARIVNNVFSGRGEVLVGPGSLENNVKAAKSDFVDPQRFDYRPRAGAAAIGRGVDPGKAWGMDLRPTAEYAHPTQMRPRSRSARLDAGALEYRSER